MEKKGNQVLLTVLGIATLLVAVTGATFAYFTATITNDNVPANQTITTGNVAVTFAQGNIVNASNLLPTTAWETVNQYQVNAEGTIIPNPSNVFTITNDGSASTNLRVDLALSTIDAGLAVTDMKWSLEAVKTSGTGTFTFSTVNGDFAGATIATPITLTTGVNGVTIPANTTVSFTLKLWVDETSVDQASLQNKNLVGKITVTPLG